MNARTLLTSACMIPVAGMLVLAGVFCDARPALAQTQQDCPLPPGVTPPDPLSVTAQQVEDGSAALSAFALAARNRFSQGADSRATQLYVGCRMRRDGNDLHAGSTYLVQLTPDGRVFVHSKNMALSGRLVNRVIYGAILRALGISLTDLTDPAAITAAFTEAAGRDGGEFNVPQIPGASGYAAVYLSQGFSLPMVLIAGFDLTESHLAEEEFDFRTPAVTARDVVDRETLKAFVTNVGEFFLASQQEGDPAGTSKGRVALRDPNGPYRHGSVYLYILDLASDIILVHGAFPDRYELRPLIATVRDEVTGKLVLPQVIEAAKSSPEGGFLEYYWDDPTDDSDRADVPKVGYARRFTGERVRADGSVLPVDFIIGSGFYGSAPEPPPLSEACPRPEGLAVNPLEIPAVTAAQAAGSAGNLKAFSLAAKRYLASIRPGQELAFSACLIRHEGPWKSGATYVVTLSTDGRVLFHSKNVALSGRPLKPAVWKAIAAATGAAALRTTGDFGNPDGGALPAQIGGGYAVGFKRTAGVSTFIMTAGLDIGESHLAEETVDPGNPRVRADQVVDRASLKTFVTGAAAYVGELLREGGRGALAKAKSVLREPNGRWRHGPVYLFMMEPNGYTVFHGAFPDKFEFQAPTTTLKDEVTGKLILPQIIEAAKNPGGGFVRYYFDNPDDDSDSADVPKVTYAFQHVFRIPRPDGSTIEYPLIFGAGLYGDSDDFSAACPLPAGVTLPLAPSVTAQQVEAGSATLKDFALAARDGLNLKQEQGLYFYNTCLMRQDGGPYRSGSTYLVQLTPDGRILIHAKDMALSPGQLNPLIYAEILSALGVPPTVLANLASTDPAVAGDALTTLFATLSQELDGPFDAGLPGASGYATSYFSENLEVPVILLAGFDLNKSHLVEEEIDYGDPAVTARDVVDRETLKAFVKEAEAYFAETIAAGGIPALSKLRLALRDPNGPWRHGSVYLYLLDFTTNSILFHGAFPDRFELRPLVPTVRDAVTGKFVMTQVIEAARSSPEGGFVEYHFDDPNDDTDSADIPKVGYARIWLDSVVIGSGFYLSDPAKDVPQVALAVDPESVTEGSGAQTVTVTATLDGVPVYPVETVIDLSLSGTATSDDYSVSGDLSVTIPAEATEGSTRLTLTATGDSVYETGGETIVVTASYDGADLDTATITVIDAYDAPATVGALPAVTLEAGDSETIDAGGLFSGTDLSFSAASSDNGVASAVLSGATLTVTGVRKGAATVTVAARNAAGEASGAVSVTVTAIAAERMAYEHILGAMGRNMLSSVSTTIGGRFSAGGGGRAVTVGGRRIDGLASGISALASLTGHRRQAASKELALLADPDRRSVSGDYLLQHSSFAYAVEDHTASGGLRWSVWGAGDMQNFQGEPDVDTSYDGDLRTAYLGFDVAAQRSWMAGIAFSHAIGQSDYDVTVASGNLESRLTSVLPYVRWSRGGGLTEVWSIAGLGTGEVEVEDATSDLSMRMAMVGVRTRLAGTGGMGLDVVGDAGVARLSTSDSESASLSDIASDVQRVRVGLEGSRSTKLSEGTTITPYAQLAGRYDGGAGQTGQGLEVSGGLRLSGGRVGINAQGRFLAVHTAEGYSENGVSLVAYLSPGAGGRGLSMSVAPRMGAATSASGMMWRERPLEDTSVSASGRNNARALRAEVGYGLAYPSMGVLMTPFGEMHLQGDDRRQMRLGARLARSGVHVGGASLELSGMRVDRRGSASDHRIGLLARMSF